MTEQQKALRFLQADVHYQPLSDQDAAACATCRWFNAHGEYGTYCHIIDNWPLDVLATGICDKHEPLPALNVPPVSETTMENAVNAVAGAIDAAVQEVVTAEASLPEAHDDQQNAAARAGGIFDQLSGIAKRIFTRKAASDAFQVFKGKDGKHYWLARHTNIFEDREKEILSSKAHAAYVARVNLGLVDMPELWAFHTKGTRHGQADIVWEHAGFVYALGHFDDTPEAKSAIKGYQKRKGKIELSHGFTYPRWALKDGVYESYNTFEISTLPEGAAANPYTTFEEVTTMALSDKQASWIKDNLGEEALKRAQEANKSGETDAEVLKALDTRYKDFAELETATTDKAALEGLEIGKTFGKVLGNLIGTQAEMSEQIETLKTDKATAEAALKTERETNAQTIKVLQDDVEALKVRLGARPRRAMDGTEVDKKDMPKDIEDGINPPESFFGIPLKK
jgi:hypothetical protein